MASRFQRVAKVAAVMARNSPKASGRSRARGRDSSRAFGGREECRRAAGLTPAVPPPPPSACEGLTGEVTHLLRYRLWLAALIFAACNALYALKYLRDIGGPLSIDPFTLSFQGAEVVVCAGIAFVCWRWCNASVAALRVL